MSSTSNTSSSGSSAAANTVVVTARDIEFSNYNSSTGKWGNAVLTMMIEDANTPDNINLEVYDEKVYAVFRNHDDPTDMIQTSAEVDGMDFRVTISTPMVASGKYELYKIYGETSGNEYATSSQFYIQVPGKVWDFANDTVEEDVELVSDWFNYGEVEDINGNVYGIPTEADFAALFDSNSTITVNGESISKNDIKKVKITSMVEGEITPTMPNTSTPSFISSMQNLEDLDIVSSKITSIPGWYRNGSYYAGMSMIRNDSRNTTDGLRKFAFPETLTNVPDHTLYEIKFDHPVYFPDSVASIGSYFLATNVNSSAAWNIFNSKIRFSNDVAIGDYFMQYNRLYNQPVVWPTRISSLGKYFLSNSPSFVQDFVFPNGPIKVPDGSVYRWGNNGSMTSRTFSITVPEGYTEVGQSFVASSGWINSVNLPSTLTKASSLYGSTSRFQPYLDMDLASKTPNLTEITYGVGVAIWGGMANLTLPEGLTTCPNILTDGWYNNNILENFEFPSTLASVNSFGRGFSVRSPRLLDENRRLKFPSTLTHIGNAFAGVYASNLKNHTLYVDLSESDPDFWGDDQYADGSRSAAYNSFGHDTIYTTPSQDERLFTWNILVAPGTVEQWKQKFPDTSYVHSTGVTVWTRSITWVEKPTPYGYVFYVESNGGQEKYVELQSQAEFESFVNPAYNSGWSTTVGEEQITLYASDTVYPKITGVTIGTDITSIPNKFMYGATALTRARGGDAVTSIGSYFCASTKINNVISFPLVTTVGANFLSGCHVFNKTVSLPNATVIGASFLEGDKVYNQPFTFPSGITVVPKSFMKYCVQFDQPLSIPNGVTTIGEWFLAGQSNAASNMYFNSAITIPSTVRSIGQCFMYYCVKFNQPLTIPASSIGQAFMYHCTDFNQPITLTASSISSLAGFMGGCTSFNQPLDLSMVTSLERSSQTAGGLLANAHSFNSDITFKQQMYKFEYMFDGWTSFNRPVTLPAKVTTGFNGTFFNNCTAFNQDVVMPENTPNYGSYPYIYIFTDCKNMKSTVTFNNNTFPTNGTFISRSFTTTDATADCYTSGINITGASATTLKNLLPDSSTSPYRKINLI